MHFEFLSNTRTCCGRITLLVWLVAIVMVVSAQAEAPASPIVIDASVASAPPEPLTFSTGGQSPTGHTFSANDRYLMLDGKPWFPLMGEFHYARYPEEQWEKELLKMKAGGIQVISTYIFWIHHEEVEGQFNWSGQRNLRRFLELCAKHGLYVWIRIGPWAHGEVRNGGFPDWLLAKAPTRENDPVYLSYVRRFDGEIAKQTKGLFWKDGGPIIGVQIENEYGRRGPGKGAEHILQLHQIAREAGLDAPFYTITGWDNAVIPSREVLPLFGGYADGFWWRSLTELPPTPNYFFTKIRCEENVGDDLHSKHPEIDAVDIHYPYLTAEMGGGMAVAYHRRPLLSADDTAAMEVVKLGSGVVGYGYYMFHGGTNPDGEKTTLQESQATGYPNDLPLKTYDFQAPLGEFGQMNPSYRVLKTFHLFLNDFGGELAPMTSYLPQQAPESKQDITTPRAAARILLNRGFIFINNHERAHQLPEHKNFQVQLKLASGVMQVPHAPINIPSDAYTIWPVNLDLGPATLQYATAQLISKLEEPRTFVFFAWPGIDPEFAFENKRGVTIESPGGHVTREQGVTYVRGIAPSAQSAIRIRTRDGASVNILVLSREQALNLWKWKVAGKERLILSPAELYFAQDEMHLMANDPSWLKAGFFPALAHPPAGFTLDKKDKKDKKDGVFQSYSAHVEPVSANIEYHKIQDVGADPPIKMGKEVAMAPEESAFDTAAQWTIKVSHLNTKSVTNVFLNIDYVGDVARLYVNGKLLTDNFYYGMPWLIGMDRTPDDQWNKLELKILPLQNHSPIYLSTRAWPSFPAENQVAQLKDIQVVPTYEVVLEVRP